MNAVIFSDVECIRYEHENADREEALAVAGALMSAAPSYGYMADVAHERIEDTDC